MHKAFCYGCKKVVVSLDEKEFRRSGHVSTKQDAESKYQIATNKLRPDVRVGEYA
jgi:hypothetical protein